MSDPLPLFFIIFINDLVDDFGKVAWVSDFTADLAISCCQRTNAIAQDMAQTEIDKVCSLEQEVEIQDSMSQGVKVASSPAASHASRWGPGIRIGEGVVRYPENLSFLGITFDLQLIFGPYIGNIK